MKALPRIELLVTDLDNTLWNWVQAWGVPFAALLEALVEKLGSDQEETLIRQIREKHVETRTLEYSNLLRELPVLHECFGDRLAAEVADPLREFRQARERELELYPHVAETLARIAAAGTAVVAYSESLQYWSLWRLERTNIINHFDLVVTLPDHRFPIERRSSGLELLSSLVNTRTVQFGQRKPNPALIESVMQQFRVSPDRTLCVGDSLVKDVLMGQQARTWTALAAYGAENSDAHSRLLSAVSHWDEEDEKWQEGLSQVGPVIPSVTLSNFGELMRHFEFARRPCGG